MPQRPVLYGRNLLDQANSSVTADAATTAQPASRLYDRDPSLFYKDCSTGTRTWLVDQGATTADWLSIDTWILGAHNLTNKVVLDAGDATGSLSNKDEFTPASTLPVRRTITSATNRYWLITASCASPAPEITELFLTVAVTLPAPHGEEDRSEGRIVNRARHESVGGAVWIATHGDERWTGTYLLTAITTADRAAVEDLYSTLDGGAKFLWLEEPETSGNLRFVEWRNDSLSWTPGPPPTYWEGTLSFQEVL